MLRRSERISTNANYQSSYAKLVDVTDAFKKIHKKITKQERVNILNQIYNILHNDFFEIRHHAHKVASKKEETFIRLLKSAKKMGEVILDELTEPDNQDIKSSKALKRIVVKTRNKINNYMDTYNNEKKQAFILLSSKIGIDIVKHVTSYL
jgi:hypothetical protein